jgi:hypothetical protein
VNSSAWACLRIRADNETGVHSTSLPEFNLSQLKVLRSLEVGDWAFGYQPTRHTIVMEVFSTIASPVFSELVIVIGAGAVAHFPSKVKFFETLRTMRDVRPFKLVFLLVNPDLFQEEARQNLAGILDTVAMRGFLDFLNSPPTIRSVRSANDSGTRPLIRYYSPSLHAVTSDYEEA